MSEEPLTIGDGKGLDVTRSEEEEDVDEGVDDVGEWHGVFLEVLVMAGCMLASFGAIVDVGMIFDGRSLRSYGLRSSR